jgi:hypothetical protein
VRFAYADPPYPGQAKKHYADHPDYGGEVDHHALIERLMDEYPDGWALSTNPSCLRWLLPLCPEQHRLLVWGKTFAAWKRNHWPAYAWEPIIMVGGRSLYGQQETPRDWIADPITMRKGVAGAKPLAFCLWLFSCLGATPEDTVDDLFPGSGAVADAWEVYCAQMPLACPSEPVTLPMETGA